jgi:hypothetical protein
MVRRRFSAVSNHAAPIMPGAILRDAASRLLRMRSGYVAREYHTTTLNRFAARVMPV